MRIVLFVTVATLAAGRDCIAQSASFMAQAIPLVTRADPTATHGPLTEGYLTQPVVMADAEWGPLHGVGTLNLEGLTLQRGELNTGGYGEGYVDRRHPHAYVHELLVGAQTGGAGSGGASRFGASLFTGRGFVPFGSDDPMMRPFVKYPVNHHLSQILERVVAVGALRYGPIIGELGAFNGDEPVGPGAAPNFSRFGDSWAGRLTLLPARGVEVSGSFAAVRSPEERSGNGLDQRKTSIVARFESSSPGDWRYALAEFAHTDELDRDITATRLSSLLGEAGYCRAGVTVAGRLERTDRPEEEATSDPFRTPRPATDLSNLGVSRWTTITASVASPPLRYSIFSARAFLEAAHITAAAGNPAGLFSPELRYGSSQLWMMSAGLRLGAGAMHSRMGRYGVAVPPGEGMQMSAEGMSHMQHTMTDRCRQ